MVRCFFIVHNKAIQELIQQQLLFTELTAEIAFKDDLLEFEKPKIVIPGKILKKPQCDNKGDSFHEKKAKNKKVNVRYNHKKAMQEKYGKLKKKR